MSLEDKNMKILNFSCCAQGNLLKIIQNFKINTRYQFNFTISKIIITTNYIIKLNLKCHFHKKNHFFDTECYRKII